MIAMTKWGNRTRRGKITTGIFAALIGLAASPANAIVDLKSDCTVRNTGAVIRVDNKKLQLPEGSAIKLKFMHFGNCLPVIITLPNGNQIAACSGFLAGQAKTQPKDVITSIAGQTVWMHTLSENPERKIEIRLDCEAATLN